MAICVGDIWQREGWLVFSPTRLAIVSVRPKLGWALTVVVVPLVGYNWPLCRLCSGVGVLNRAAHNNGNDAQVLISDRVLSVTDVLKCGWMLSVSAVSKKQRPGSSPPPE